jgi:hypothetical protein
MTITNTGSAPDRVSCVSSDASAECQIHIMAIANGVMKMRRIEDSLEIRPNETAVFKPACILCWSISSIHWTRARLRKSRLNSTTQDL